MHAAGVGNWDEIVRVGDWKVGRRLPLALGVEAAGGHARWAGLTSVAVIVALFGLGVWSFYAMYAAFGVPLRG